MLSSLVVGYWRVDSVDREKTSGGVMATGRLLLRLPKSIHVMIKRVAAEEGVSINQFILAALSFQLGGNHGSLQKEAATLREELRALQAAQKTWMQEAKK